ncbi:hypothetical protein Tco_1404322 [Tanacetum coccineum]
MHTRASNSKLVEPLPEPERTLNQRLRRRNRRVPYDQRNNPPQNPRIVYPLILNINYFCYFLDILQNYDPMDDEPMWAFDHVVAPTPGSIITIPETANEFAIKDAWLRMKEMLRNCHGHNLSKCNIIKIFYHGLNKITQEVLYYCLLRVNAVGTKLQLLKVTTAERLQLLKDKDCLKIKITYEIRIVIYTIDL